MKPAPPVIVVFAVYLLSRKQPRQAFFAGVPKPISFSQSCGLRFWSLTGQPQRPALLPNGLLKRFLRRRAPDDFRFAMAIDSGTYSRPTASRLVHSIQRDASFHKHRLNEFSRLGRWPQ